MSINPKPVQKVKFVVQKVKFVVQKLKSVLQTSVIALALRARAVLLAFEKFTRAYLFQIALEIM